MVQNVVRKVSKFPALMTMKVADCNFGFGGHSKAILEHFRNSRV